uniref:HOOK N-terminal domain-containing protein n=1 Tax=Setaria digitata TaxID=48799 RepID=A0A915PY36_9BILA
MNSLTHTKEVTLVDIFSGRSIAEALYNIDPLFFNDNWLDSVSHYDQMANWRLKANNLRKIYRRLSEYYTDQLGAELTPEWFIDTSRIAEHNDLELLCRLLQLVLGAALLGPNNERFIRFLLDQNESVQRTAVNIMQEIKDLVPKPSEEEIKVAETSNAEPAESREQMANLKSKVESLKQECTQLNEKLKEACSEKEALSSDNESLRLRVDELNEGSIEIESLRKQIRSLRSLRESTQDTLYKIEAERDHLKKVYLQTLDENAELRTKIQDMTPMETEFKRLKDELEENRLIVQKYEKLDNQITNYKAKLKQWKIEKIEMKILEDKVATYMKSVIALEDEKRKNGALKTQIESLRLENTELGTKLNDEIRRADKAEFELKQLIEQIKETEKEREHLRKERNELNEQLLLHENDDSAPSLLDETADANSVTILRERITQLEIEKERLLAGYMTDNEKLGLKDEVTSLTIDKRNLETELKLAQNRVDKLEKRLKEVNAIVESWNFINSDRLTEEQTANERMVIQIAQLEAKLEQVTHDLEQQVADKKMLNGRHELTTSKQEVKNERDRLTRYMEKARRMIEDLEEQNRAVEGGALSRHEFDSIRRERDTYKQNIEAMKESYERSRAMQEEEQRLFTTHAYYMMMQLQQQNPSAAEHSDDKSFLTRQRQCGSFNIISLLAAVLCLMLALVFFSKNSPSLYSEVSFTGLPPT